MAKIRRTDRPSSQPAAEGKHTRQSAPQAAPQTAARPAASQSAAAQSSAAPRTVRTGQAARTQQTARAPQTQTAEQPRTRAPQAEPPRAEKPRRKKRGRITLLLLILQAVAGVALGIQVYRTHFLPAMYLAAIYAALVLAWLLLLGISRARLLRPVACLLSLAVTAASVMGCVYTTQGLLALEVVASGDVTRSIDVYVLNESSAEKLSDLKGSYFGVLNNADRENTDACLTEMSKTVEHTDIPSGYDSVYSLIDALYNGDVDAIVMDRSYASLLAKPEKDENGNDILTGYEDFGDRARSVYSYSLLTNTLKDSLSGEAKAMTTEPFIIYLSGSDTRTALGENDLSDVNILAAVNPSTKQVLLISTPRDYYVDVPGYGNDKLTHAGRHGVTCSMETLSELYGVDVDYYIKLDFQGFIDIINALGGVDINVDETFTTVATDYYDPIMFTEGGAHLDGTNALAYVRERKNCKDGDNARGRHQMQVILAALNKCRTTAVLRGYTSILASVSENVATNVSKTQIGALVRMQLKDGAEWECKSFSVTGTNDMAYTATYPNQQLYVMQPDEASIEVAKALLTQLMNGEPLTAADEYEAAAAAAQQ